MEATAILAFLTSPIGQSVLKAALVAGHLAIDDVAKVVASVVKSHNQKIPVQDQSDSKPIGVTT